MDNHTIDKLVAESLVNRLAEGELNRAHLEARYTLTLAELQAFKAVLEYDPALKCWNMNQPSKNYLKKHKLK